ncbi:MAG: hypothetical protein DWQ47_08440 [Acidobacteria bacterium]|nr:MAG: hypothetical protein DWQ32_16540 [Acidobacteriota bacterium]REJ99062.1 MAG: hypothetical protein DWQ38_13440 [Acidobacteriota bacterium]REK16218.1 MAG: hypothetical protein DWQ43_04250 [Acidobacteriota bacterium]REK43899.1 MAG: hypothetical protein DWQ47_08440 [Acidobacteriota bacterium]
MHKPEFNTTGYPLGYLITFRCYGTWLPGNVRGTVTKYQNGFGQLYLPPDDDWQDESRSLLKSDPVMLDRAMRKEVSKSIRRTCDCLGWALYALNVRTNHVHIVVDVGTAPSSSIVTKFKAYATRDLREKNLWSGEHSPWASRGSCRYLWHEEALWKAIDYVIYSQGRDLPGGI